MRTKWTPEKLQEEALKYETRGEFAKKNGNAYAAALRRGSLDTICSHMAAVLTYWTLEKLQEEALKYKTKGEFCAKNTGAYSTAVQRKILDQICTHMPKYDRLVGKRNPKFKWSDEALQLEALKYNSRSEFEKNSLGAYNCATKRRLMDLICAHMGEPQNKPWTNQELAEEALKYKTRGEFVKNSGGAYQSAHIKGILDEICFHMPERVDVSGEKSHNFKWTFEKLQEEALKYKTREEFRKNSSAHSTASNKKILDQLCQHMTKSGKISCQERDLFGAIKKLYPKTQILKDTKVKIEGKPHIHGFELDIYIPELRKAIEFDGTYWHSIPGLRRGRPNWPDEDLKIYHELKDAWFSAKGIEIFHLNSDDWKANQQACIDKCLEFLGNPPL